jgi:hypothetical protein
MTNGMSVGPDRLALRPHTQVLAVGILYEWTSGPGLLLRPHYVRWGAPVPLVDSPVTVSVQLDGESVAAFAGNIVQVVGEWTGRSIVSGRVKVIGQVDSTATRIGVNHAPSKLAPLMLSGSIVARGDDPSGRTLWVTAVDPDDVKQQLLAMGLTDIKIEKSKWSRDEIAAAHACVLELADLPEVTAFSESEKGRQLLLEVTIKWLTPAAVDIARNVPAELLTFTELIARSSES